MIAIFLIIMADDAACPRCKTTKYRNPSLRLMVNVCGHALCDSCVELLFVKGSAVCGECGISLRRANFRVQLFEDAYVEREVDVRKRVLRDYNKREDDFESLRDYNDYLEEIEEIIFNLTNDVDVENTKRRIEQYRQNNRIITAKNKCKSRTRDEELLDELIGYEEQECAYRQQKILEEQKQESRMKTKNKEALIDELMFSDAPASEILATHAAEQLLRVQNTDETQQVSPKKQFMMRRPHRQTKFSSGIQFWQADSFLPISKIEAEDIAYKYDGINRDLCGPRPPPFSDLTKKGYLEDTKEKDKQESAAGFLPKISCYRALEEALCGLFHLGSINGGSTASDSSVRNPVQQVLTDIS